LAHSRKITKQPPINKTTRRKDTFPSSHKPIRPDRKPQVNSQEIENFQPLSTPFSKLEIFPEPGKDTSPSSHKPIRPDRKPQVNSQEIENFQPLSTPFSKLEIFPEPGNLLSLPERAAFRLSPGFQPGGPKPFAPTTLVKRSSSSRHA